MADRIHTPQWLLAGAARMLLIVYGMWQDESMAVKYTDADYQVFSDAARMMAMGDSPFERATYRYSPSIAMLLLPNVWVGKLWGKLLFASTDLLVGCLLARILMAQKTDKQQLAFLVNLWILNPIVVNVSTRGNAEALVSLVVMATILAVVQDRPVLAGLFLGLAVHVKVYPIIYSLPLYLSFCREIRRVSFFSDFFNKRSLQFAFSAILSFSVLTGAFFVMYGHRFLHEAYIYHVFRVDHRHNFSLYFYQMYLSMDTSARLVGLVAFAPQVVILIAISLRYGRRNKIGLCICCQTIAFVAFNKVFTVQYLVWYFALLPLAFASGFRVGYRSG
ncbi:hypothetical protein GUITHDRAFT_98711 [Guillardia theta CCMP2712]|uniref:GPI mannosyltransferase 1 n=1 Tax=Guillardia theta (strain CCMP2712) TaxID=905079 RepID=L1I7P0_GUITC|nr:hypothetical protein GUITHDRAFT_98711 [Guillardia theta CCMP2712]EKX31909.1 hypothetical protein GUITHDRAFT_98711 [Guillardia theta CCMP2712]|eukprot:XP_005818889.1 hypothetical protein GUITHDRAFT_98711 [Guillardia theta CCMP2712]